MNKIENIARSIRRHNFNEEELLHEIKQRKDKREELSQELEQFLDFWIKKCLENKIVTIEHDDLFAHIRTISNKLGSQYLPNSIIASRRLRRRVGIKKRAKVYKRDNYTCVYCGWQSPTKGERNSDAVTGKQNQGRYLEIDHKIPESEGGNNHMANLVTSCNICNKAKANIVLQLEELINEQKEEKEETDTR